MAFLRLLVIGFATLSVIYAIVVLAERRRIRNNLVNDWQESGRPGTRKAYLRAGLAAYETSLGRKLLLAVFVVPVVTVATIIYVVNFR